MSAAPRPPLWRLYLALFCATVCNGLEAGAVWFAHAAVKLARLSAQETVSSMTPAEVERLYRAKVAGKCGHG